MAKNIVSRVDRNLARRLREARREVGLSTRAVCAKLPRRLAISHSTLAAYENGVSTPPVDTLAALADVYGRPINWFLESRDVLGGFRYRNLKPRVPLAEQRKFEAVASKWADAYLNLERYLSPDQPRRKQPLSVRESLSPAELASVVRKSILDLDDDQPVQNMVGVLEKFSAWALEINPSFSVDSAAASHGNDIIVVLNPELPNERLRMMAAHELAYMIYDETKTCMGWTDAIVERKAYEFALSLLIPASQLAEAFEGKSFLKLIQYKEKFGMSLFAMIHMAEKLRLITTTVSRCLWREMASRGWRNDEPGYVWRDRAITFETMLDCAIQSKSIAWADAERITGVCEEELRLRIAGVLNNVVQKSSDRESRPIVLNIAGLSISREPEGQVDEV